MYLNYYNLNKEPFHITPDPEFLYLSPSHKEAMAGIIYGIEQKKGFVAIIGAVGVGKTTILRFYLDNADKQRMKIIYVLNARLTFTGLLKTIYEELELPIETDDTMEMVNKLYHVLIDEYNQGDTVLLVIDEAQNMPIETLEDIRMLSNLETTKDKLIQIVLLGQPEFEENLNMSRLRQLKQRIAIRSTILPLTRDESLDYIKHRTLKAGGHVNTIFTKQALREIVKKAQGIPRVINILCDNALISGFGYQQKPVEARVVKEVIADIDGKKKQRFSKWQIALGFSTILLLFSMFAALYYSNLSSLNFSGKELSEKSVSQRPQEKQEKPAPPKVSSISKHENPDGAQERPSAATALSTVEKKTLSGNSTPAVVANTQTHNRTTTEKEEPAVRRRAPARQRNTAQPAPQVESSQKLVRTKRDKPARSTEDERARSDDNFTTLIRESKPQIVDPNLIATGSNIKLPTPSAE
jgi:general secretion pathway protein A